VRRNPFRNRAVQRPKVDAYGKVVAMTPLQVQAFMQAIQEEPRPLVRARDNALFLAYLLTGRRASEIVVMQWGDITTGDKEGTYQFRYIGKGPGQERGEDASWKWQSLPTPVYYAIVGWLKLAGRWEGITVETYVFGPMGGRGQNFGSELPENRHVAARRVGQLMDKVAKRARLPRMHPHQLRHTFAHHLYEASGGDIRLVSGLLDHKSIATTQIYIGKLERKEDTYSTKLMAQLGLQL
jgi:integrase/recombinase XerC